MKRFLSAVRSSADKIIELSRGVMGTKDYGDCKQGSESRVGWSVMGWPWEKRHVPCSGFLRNSFLARKCLIFNLPGQAIRSTHERTGEQAIDACSGVGFAEVRSKTIIPEVRWPWASVGVGAAEP